MRGSTKTEQIYWTLRRAIVVGDLLDDAPLDELILMQTYDVGRTPLREALKRLADDQLIVFPPHRTPHVRGMTTADLPRLYEARGIVEIPAARLASRERRDLHVEGLKELLAQMAASVANNDPYRTVELDHEFHTLVAEASGNRFLRDAVARLNCGSLRLWYTAHSKLGMGGVEADHRAIVEAVADADEEKAIAAAATHITHSYQRQIEVAQLSSDRIVQQYAEFRGDHDA